MDREREKERERFGSVLSVIVMTHYCLLVHAAPEHYISDKRYVLHPIVANTLLLNEIQSSESALRRAPVNIPVCAGLGLHSARPNLTYAIGFH